VTNRREIPAADFFVTHFTTSLEPGELVVGTIWPVEPDMSSALGTGHVPQRGGIDGERAPRTEADTASALGAGHVPGSRWGFAFEEFSQRRGDYGLAVAAAALRIEDGRVAEARVGLASVVDRPTLVETELVGNTVTPELARATGDAAAASIDAWGNMHASSNYLRQLTRVCVERAVLRAAA
jgi:CO/xanthine dehydrogenase FAD-binding subunit